MSIFNKINPFKKETSQESEETTTKEETSEETSAAETPEEETPTEEVPVEETSAEEVPAEEPPAEETPPEEEAPTEETTTTEAPAEEPAKKDWFLSILHFLKTNKFVHEIFMIFFIVALFFMAVLSYGEFTKREGIPSFETFQAEHTGKKIATLFAEGDFKTLLSYLYVDTPSIGRRKDAEQALCVQTAKQIKKEYEKLFSGLTLSVSKADATYQMQDSGEIHLVTTCHISISEHAEILLTLEQYQENKYTMSIATDDKKDEQSFHKMNALFAYASAAYSYDTDEEITCAFISGDKKNLSSISAYFYSDPTKENNKKYSKQLETRLQQLDSLDIAVTQAFIEPYTYNEKDSLKTSSLTLRCLDKETGETFVYYQPLIIGFYGYEADGSCSIYGNTLRPEVYNAFSLLFVET